MTRDNVLFKLLGKHLSDSRSLQISPEILCFDFFIIIVVINFFQHADTAPVSSPGLSG